ncbi:MAG: hydantoinase/oxoprolinase family protein, partial [Natronomonas sp.]
AKVENDVPATEYEGIADPERGTRTAVFDGERHEIPVFARDGVAPGTTIDGPVVLEDHESTVVVRPGWAGTVRPNGALVLDGGAER